MGNLIQTLLPAVILLLQGKIAKQVSPYTSSILTLIIRKWEITHVYTNHYPLHNLRILIFLHRYRFALHVRRGKAKVSSSMFEISASVILQ